MGNSQHKPFHHIVWAAHIDAYFVHVFAFREHVLLRITQTQLLGQLRLRNKNPNLKKEKTKRSLVNGIVVVRTRMDIRKGCRAPQLHSSCYRREHDMVCRRLREDSGFHKQRKCNLCSGIESDAKKKTQRRSAANLCRKEIKQKQCTCNQNDNDNISARTANSQAAEPRDIQLRFRHQRGRSTLHSFALDYQLHAPRHIRTEVCCIISPIGCVH